MKPTPNPEPKRTYNFGFKCPSCGAMLQMSMDRLQSFCSFCGAQLPDAKELIDYAMHSDEVKASREHELEMENKRIEQEKEKRSTIRTESLSDSLIVVVPVLSILGLLFGLVWILNQV